MLATKLREYLALVFQKNVVATRKFLDSDWICNFDRGGYIRLVNQCVHKDYVKCETLSGQDTDEVGGQVFDCLSQGSIAFRSGHVLECHLFDQCKERCLESCRFAQRAESGAMFHDDAINCGQDSNFSLG